MFRKLGLVVTILMSFFLVACAGSSKNSEDNAWGTGYSKEYLASLNITKDPLEYTTVYFEYDSSSIDERSKIILSAHAKSLSTRSGVNVVLEGHTDERGTREYNLALGERRAASAQDLMKATGAGNNSLSLVTYGEERPVALTQDDASWQANRRVQILY